MTRAKIDSSMVQHWHYHQLHLLLFCSLEKILSAIRYPILKIRSTSATANLHRTRTTDELLRAVVRRVELRAHVVLSFEKLPPADIRCYAACAIGLLVHRSCVFFQSERRCPAARSGSFVLARYHGWRPPIFETPVAVRGVVGRVFSVHGARLSCVCCCCC